MINKNRSEQLLIQGLQLKNQGNLDHAIQCFQQSLQLNQLNISAGISLGTTLFQAGHAEQAKNAFQQVLKLDPGNLSAINNLAAVQLQNREFSQAIKLLKNLAKKSGASADIFFNLGLAYQGLGNHAQAIQKFSKAIQKKSDHVASLNALGLLKFEHLKAPEEALKLLIKALHLAPEFGFAWHNLGLLLYTEGELFSQNYLEELKSVGLNEKFTLDVQCYQKAVALMPDNLPSRTNLIFSLNNATQTTPLELATAHYQFGEKIAELYPEILEKFREREPILGRKIRIGYFSGDFRAHPVGRLIAPLLEQHDRDNFEIHGFYNEVIQDELTQRIKSSCDFWHDIAGLNLTDSVNRIIQGKIDIMVDLSGHTAKNSLEVFSLKPAPVTVSWMGYFNTTGLKNMDFCLSDVNSIPDSYINYYSEQVIQLPNIYGFEPPQKSPQVTVRTDDKPVVFGSFNRASKLTTQQFTVWAQILTELPEAKLRIFGIELSKLKESIIRFFRQHNIEENRLDFRGRFSFYEYLEAHGDIDIILDTFPFSGGTTTLYGLWMGVPIITINGSIPAGHLTSRHLKHVGLEELVVNNPQEYIAKAVSLAQDGQRLKCLQNGLRDKVLSSPFVQLDQIMRSVEQVYREMLSRRIN